ncbi:MAG: segregation/condensation protein A [Lachnospiraceae bacterium]|nr:segregation/condensation protein A [Lachnospiraceae bacterium]MBR1524588.1 segregation/condensation protein A [Lachnospiraceae bacterium]
MVSELEFKLEKFEGPLDLLLHLIDKNKVDIYDIPIALITEQYMEYLDKMKEDDYDMDTMSEFLVMASTLLDIKCRMLLPKEKDEEGEEIDPRTELVQRLLEYKIYKYASLELKDMSMDASRALYKGSSMPDEILNMEIPIDYDKLVGDNTLQKLNAIFDELMRRQEDKIDPVRSKFGTIEKEEVDAEAKTAYIRDFAREHKRFSFRELLSEAGSKAEIIISFLCILEMMKNGEVEAKQTDIGEDIEIIVKEIA